MYTSIARFKASIGNWTMPCANSFWIVLSFSNDSSSFWNSIVEIRCSIQTERAASIAWMRPLTSEKSASHRRCRGWIFSVSVGRGECQTLWVRSQVNMPRNTSPSRSQDPCRIAFSMRDKKIWLAFRIYVVQRTAARFWIYKMWGTTAMVWDYRYHEKFFLYFNIS